MHPGFGLYLAGNLRYHAVAENSDLVASCVSDPGDDGPFSRCFSKSDTSLRRAGVARSDRNERGRIHADVKGRICHA
jgi:hypothetical protein